MKLSRYFLLPGLACSAALLLGQQAGAQSATAAGTVIPNTASASYALPQGPAPLSSQANTVSTTVLGVCRNSVTVTGTPGTLLPGETGQFAFKVSNAGNGENALNLSAALSSDVGSVKVYRDSNGNGQLDSGEEEISSLKLAAGASQSVVVVSSTAKEAAAGDYTLTLTASCGSGDATVATTPLKLGNLPKLSVSKSFDKKVIKPGDTTTVTISARNAGGNSREVILTDPLQSLSALGLVFDGSAQASAGSLEYSTDGGASWSATSPAQPETVTALRLRASQLALNESLTLSFRMKALEKADGSSFENVVTLLSGAESGKARATVDVHYTPGVALGPKGNPQAAENTPADTQTVDFSAVGQSQCFDHTLLNSGDAQDTYKLTLSFSKGQAKYRILDGSGQALGPVTLQPGESKAVKVCYDLKAEGSLDSLITATGERGVSNTTRDIVSTISAGLPELKKTSDASETDPLANGGLVTYTLSVRNPYQRELHNVTVQDALPAHTQFVTASQGGVNNGGVVSWSLGTLTAGETRTLKVTVKIAPEAQDGEQIANTFTFTSQEFPAPLLSNTVNNVVWNAQIRIDKTVDQTVAAPGDALTYTLVIHNDSAQATLYNAVVTDHPAAGLTYIPGSSTLEGQPLSDPTIDSDGMQWSIGDLAPSKDVRVTYKMRLRPGVSGDLLNEVKVEGYAGVNSVSGNAVRKVASNLAKAIVRPNLLNFSPISDIVGTVFIDRNRNGIFDKSLDTPIERARVILAGGRLALTDKDGRYHFANVPLGTQALRLDPTTTTYIPLMTSQSQGLSGTQTVFVRGLTNVDFPLAPMGGDIAAIRRTSLDMGDLSLSKAVYHTDQGYVVVIEMRAAKALEQFEMTDPLPGNAKLQEGRNVWKGTLPAGVTTLNYRFSFAGGDEAAVTDPSAVWRY